MLDLISADETQAAPAQPFRVIARHPLTHWAAITGFFFAATVVQTWPLVLHMGDQLMAWPPDVYTAMWTLWWFKDALLELHNPMQTDMVLYPQGASLYMHTATAVNSTLSIPLQVVTGNIILSWNILVLAFFTASGVGGYALARRFTENVPAALFAGYMFAFSPFVLVHINGHFNIGTTWPVPFFALTLVMFQQTGRLRYALAAGGLLALMTFNWYEFAIDSILLVVLFAAFFGAVHVRRGDYLAVRRLAAGVLCVAGVWLVLSLPILVPSLLEIARGNISLSGGLAPPAEYYSADLLGYVTPSSLWGPGKTAEPDLPGTYPTAIGGVEGTVYLGFLPLLLGAAAVLLLAKSRKRHWIAFWFVVFAFFAAMALGPFLYVGGEKEVSFGGVTFSLSLPFRVFKEIPIIGLRRVPARMVVFAVLALSILSATGLAAIAERLRRNGQNGRASAIGVSVAALALLALEFWNPPVDLRSYQTPAAYELIARDPGDVAVLDLPVGRITGTLQRGDIVGGAMTMYGQIVHHKPVIGGYLARGNEDDILWLRTMPGLKYLSCPTCPGFPDHEDNDPNALRRTLRELNIGYVVLHRTDFEGQPTSYVTSGVWDEVLGYLQGAPGLAMLTQDESSLTFVVR
ncbi:MAG TPA: hypothetical protein VFP63_01170 [Dehalococcoidia bacterium]|nr:hypothetical protein [Dehalococcoidia bacterium]